MAQARVGTDGRLYVPGVILRKIPEQGRARVLVRCSLCKAEQPVYLWSWGGRGKKCVGCELFLERPADEGG